MSEDRDTEVSDMMNQSGDESDKLNSDLSRSNSDTHLHQLSMELANRGPRQSELELR